MKIITQEIFDPSFNEKKIKVFMRRLDLISHPVSGNKYFKLKYNIDYAIKSKLNTIITFGGAYSNHILATSIFSKENNLKSVGFIRGEETLPLNSTLTDAVKNGMEIIYLSRKNYRKINDEEYLNQLRIKYKKSYIIPEGGTNSLAIRGTESIIKSDEKFEYICCPIGTGGTISGIINSSNHNQKIIGFSAIKGVKNIIDNISNNVNKDNWNINEDYCQNGYAKISKDLIDFIYNFYETKNIPLDAIYTGKMMMGVLDQIKKNKFTSGSNILIIHTGGIQGNRGINQRFNLNLPHNF